VPPAARRAAGALVLVGLLGICVGTYGLLSVGSPAPLQLPVLVAGVGAAVAGLAAAGRRSPRSRYRPDPWAGPEWLVAGSGVVVAAGVVAAAMAATPGLLVPTAPAIWPPLPLLPAAIALVGLVPAWVAPPPPRVAAARRPPRAVVPASGAADR